MTEILGIAMVMAAIAIVGSPLLKKESPNEQLESVEDTELMNLLMQKEAVFSAIGELDSDYTMGNLSAADYGELRQKYEQKAVSIMKEIDGLQREQDEEIEREILQLRREVPRGTAEAALACPSCGAELGPEDNFCPACGTASGLVCPSCGARSEPGHRFCSQCGALLNEAEHD